MVRTLVVVVLALVGSSGCGASPAVGDGGGADVFLTCADDTRAMAYQAGMQVRSDGEAFVITLLSSNPGPPVKGQNTWLIEVAGVTSGTPLSGLDIEVMPWMPDHGHGTTIPVVVTPDEPPGTYKLNPVYLFMSGVWQVRFTIVGAMVGQGTTDTAVIAVCIP